MLMMNTLMMMMMMMMMLLLMITTMFLILQLIVRFMCDLANANVLLAECVVAMLEACVGVVREDGVPQVSRQVSRCRGDRF
jgi:hypothetical protein